MHMFNYMHEESIVMKIYKNEYGMLVMIIGVLTAVVGGILAFYGYREAVPLLV